MKIQSLGFVFRYKGNVGSGQNYKLNKVAFSYLYINGLVDTWEFTIIFYLFFICLKTSIINYVKKQFEPHQNALFLVCDLWLPCEMKNYYFLVTSVTEVPREDLSSHKSHTSKKQLWWDFQR